MGQPETVEPLVKQRPATIVVPAYQEEAGIARTVAELDRMCRRLSRWSWEIIVVDDGSRDGTSREAACAAAAATTEVKILRHRANAGLGGALRTGILASRGDLVLTADADLSYSVETLERLAEEFASSGAGIVVASPYMPGGSTVGIPRMIELRSRAANRWLRANSDGALHTLTGVVRAYDGDLVRSMSLKSADADINAEILYKAQALEVDIREIPAILDWSGLAHRAGRSGLLGRRARRVTYRQLFNGYLWHPSRFPLVAAFVLALPGLALLLTGRLGWEGFAAVCLLGSVLLAFHALATAQAKHYFEELFALGTSVRAVVGAPPQRAADPVAADRVRTVDLTRLTIANGTEGQRLEVSRPEILRPEIPRAEIPRPEVAHGAISIVCSPAPVTFLGDPPPSLR